ncbi:hypothetical protein B566_EDAN003652 [Ephemera danica]|nr:hypothetical protein B566_EDAN003652 [Ephemera danica]
MPSKKRGSTKLNVDAPEAKRTKRNSLAPVDTVKASGIARPRSPNVYRLPPLFPNLEDRQAGILLAIGQNDVGQLGLGEDVECAKKPKQVPNLTDIVSVACGGMHTVCLHKSGEVSTFGCNDAGALGRETKEDSEELEPAKVSLPGKAIQVSAGDSHSAALLEDGKVYAWGSFRVTAGKSERKPVQLLAEKEVAKISSGDDHLVLLTVDGFVYTCGNPESGQLGRLSQRFASRDTRQGIKSLLTPFLVDIHPHHRSSVKVRCNDIACGGYCTFAKDANTGNIYVFGLSNYKQIGLENEEPQYHPTAKTTFQDNSWKQISGKVYSLGRHHDGRLGLGESCDVTLNPTLVPALQDKICTQVECGSTVSFALTDNGKVYSWGFGQNLQLGTGDEDDAFEPVLVTGKQLEGRKVMAVASGGQHTMLIAKPE